MQLYECNKRQEEWYRRTIDARTPHSYYYVQIDVFHNQFAERMIVAMQQRALQPYLLPFQPLLQHVSSHSIELLCACTSPLLKSKFFWSESRATKSSFQQEQVR